jgi:tetratricopeptide (TPR) repeat protein
MTNELAEKTNSRKLDTWKEIAAFFGRDERTVKRWEKDRGLPVHRLPGGRRGTVYAYPEELTSWLSSANTAEELEAPSSAAPELVEEVQEVVATEAPNPPAKVTPNSQRWLIYGLGLVAALLLLLGLGFFFKPHFLQGHVLPAFSTLADNSIHKRTEDLYLQGRYHWNKRTPADLTMALDLFGKATELDPKYALAYAGKADCYNLLREYTSMPASQAFPLAIAAAKKSIELDDKAAEGHRALAFATFFWDWDVTTAEREFQRAIELNPKDVETHHWYATMLLTLARYPEAIEQIEEARKLDPLSSSVAADRAVILYDSGRKEEGIALLEELKTSDPNFFSPPHYLAAIYLQEGNFPKYFDEAETAARMCDDQHTLGTIRSLRKKYETGGEQAALKGVLDDRLQDVQLGRGDAISVAESYAMMGRNDEAIEYLKKAYDRHDYMLIAMANWKVFDKMRNEPDFQELMKKVYSREDNAPKSTAFAFP